MTSPKSSPTKLALSMLTQRLGSQKVPGDQKPGQMQANPTDTINRAIELLQGVLDQVPDLKGIVEDLQNIVESEDYSTSGDSDQEED